MRREPRDVTLSEPTSTSALGDVRTRREDLRRRMVELEQVLAAAAGDDPEAWWARVRTAAEALREEFHFHVVTTEKPDGFLDEVVAEAPHLAPRRADLEREHRSIGASLDALAGSPFVADDAGVASVLDAALTVLGALARHRHRGAEFIYDAYNVDIGASD